MKPWTLATLYLKNGGTDLFTVPNALKVVFLTLISDPTHSITAITALLIGVLLALVDLKVNLREKSFIGSFPGFLRMLAVACLTGSFFIWLLWLLMQAGSFLFGWALTAAALITGISITANLIKLLIHVIVEEQVDATILMKNK